MKITPPEQAINDVLNACMEQADEGGSQWPGMTYEQGVEAGIKWVIGDTTANPMEG